MSKAKYNPADEAKPGHLANKGPLNFPVDSERARRSALRGAATNRFKKIQPVQLSWSAPK